MLGVQVFLSKTSTLLASSLSGNFGLAKTNRGTTVEPMFSTRGGGPGTLTSAACKCISEPFEVNTAKALHIGLRSVLPKRQTVQGPHSAECVRTYADSGDTWTSLHGDRRLSCTLNAVITNYSSAC